MVTTVRISKSLHNILYYNERKVEKGVAACIYARNFLKEAERLYFLEKVKRFEALITLNKRALTNAVHISLNFGLNEKLQRDKLSEIATVYMEKIGLDHQPYLVYQHFDAAHPHIHIVTTNIKSDGKRISLHNVNLNESFRARKEIEIIFELVKAEDQPKRPQIVEPLHVERVIYGKSPTHRGITSVLDAILPNYKFTSLDELNAILKLYNVHANRGKEGGILFKNRGLLYGVLDDKGKKIGMPVKASSIYNRPTLPYLEKKFNENRLQKLQHQKSLLNSIDWTMIKRPTSLEVFTRAIEKEKIHLDIQKNGDGIISGLTYIDHKTKCVYNSEELGINYSVKSILEKCHGFQLMSERKTSYETKVSSDKEKQTPVNYKLKEQNRNYPNSGNNHPLDRLKLSKSKTL